MSFAQASCVALLVVQAARFVLAQEPSVTPPQGPTTPAREETERTAKETKKRLEQLACGPSGVHFTHHTEKGPQALAEQPPGRGLIYVIRTNNWSLAGAVQAKLAMDGKWVGVNRQANYFYIEVDPGPHYFCFEAGAGARGLLSLVIDKGKTYYLKQNFSRGEIDLDVLSEEEGKKYVASYHRSTFDMELKK